jgi:dynamin 1-like protein
MDFLPRGSGVVTRRPLELRLINTKNCKVPYGKFEEIPGKEFTNFAEIKDKINEVTDKVAGKSK